jgi:hypothetical protein
MEFAIYEDGIIQMILFNKPEKEVKDSLVFWSKQARGKKYTYKKVETTIKELD